MRVIQVKQIIYFYCLLAPALLAAVGVYQVLVEKSEHPFYRYLLALFSGVSVFYFVLLICYRLYLRLFPFALGPVEPNSIAESRWMVYSLFWLLFYYPLILPKWVPVPLSGLMYRLLGARIGVQSYFSSMIYDPHLVSIGHHVLGGAQSMIIPHVTEGDRLAHYPIRIGNHVTIGAGAIILPGVIIEDQVLVGAGAVVVKGSHLKSGEVWVGNPARCLKRRAQVF